MERHVTYIWLATFVCAVLSLGQWRAFNQERELTSRALTGIEREASLISARDSVEVPLQSESGGFWVDVKLNDRLQQRMLVDTGASVIILPGRLARTLGIEQEGIPRQLRTVQGLVQGRLVELERVTLGGASVSGVQAVILDEEGGDSVGLLGRSFLNRFAFSVDPDRGVMALRLRQRSAQGSSPAQQEEFPRLFAFRPLEGLHR